MKPSAETKSDGGRKDRSDAEGLELTSHTSIKGYGANMHYK